MKKILILCALSAFAMANMHFEKNKKCSECHPTIYSEYKTSQHGKATIFKDPIHGAVYEKHPQYNKKEKYRCGHCHTPTADNLSALLKSNNGVTPDADNETQNEAVACAYCHRIEDVKHGVAMNKNLVSLKEKVYFTSKSNPGTSPFHGIKTKKSIFKDGKMCIGCHSHKSNKKEFQVCATDLNNNASKKNCIECHMHKVDGAPSTMSTGKTHTFHGFPGLHGDLTNLSQYVTMNISNTSDKKMFTVLINHDVPHASLLHPLRSSKLVVTVTRNGSVTKMQDRIIAKTIGSIKDGKPVPTPPWLATQIVKNTTIPANTKKAFPYAWDLKSGDVITAIFGYYLVKPKALKKFDLKENKEATKFRVIRKETFTVK
ncbi:MAG: multiheme c-type cytochrome [Sulfurovum sp.]|nr:multiheme c-type cytochrome [Sulfurovum sp.]